MNFFPRQAIAKILSILHSRYKWDTPYRVLLDLGNSLTRRNRPIFKIIIASLFEIIANFRKQYELLS